jgi:NADH dehydrogenase
MDCGSSGALVAGLDANSLVERVERIRVNQFSQVKVMMIFCCRRYRFYGNRGSTRTSYDGSTCFAARKTTGEKMKLIQNKAMEPFEYNDMDRWQL